MYILCCLCCANYLPYLLSLRILDRQEQLACVFAVTIGIFLASFGVPRSMFFWVPDLMAVQLNVASGNENTQGLWRGTVPDGSAKHQRLAWQWEIWSGQMIYHADSMYGLSFAGWGQRTMVQFFFISPKTPETGTTCSIVLGVFLPKMCEGSSGNDGVWNQLVGGNGREDWSGHMAHWYCHVGLCSITARLAAENGVVDVVLWGAATSWWTGIKTRSKML